MKRTIGLLILLLWVVFTNANEIDKLSTKEDVQKFLIANLGEEGIIFVRNCVDITQIYRSEKVEIVDPITREVARTALVYSEPDTNGNYWDFPFVNYKFDDLPYLMDTGRYQYYKADIDGNGYTDLIVDAGFIIVVMDMVSSIDGYMLPSGLDFKDVFSLKDRSNALLLKYKPCGADTDVVDTIVYKFNAFVKYNPSYKPLGVRNINYYFNCSSDMTQYERYTCMQINKDGRCFLKYRSTFYPERYDTTFSATLDPQQLSDILDLGAYINVKSYKDFYGDHISHAEGGTFVIHFDDGTIKMVRMWDCPPPMSLGYLSKNIAGISRQLKWQPAETQLDFECPCERVGDSTGDCGCEL